MSNLEIYCVTDKEIPFLEESNYKLAAVGKGKFSEKYLKCNFKDNIFHKEQNYSELTSSLILVQNANDPVFSSFFFFVLILDIFVIYP